MERIEKKVVKSAIRSLINIQPILDDEKVITETQASGVEQVRTTEPKKRRNERAYLRYRGKVDNVSTKPMSYYVSDQIIDFIAIAVKLGEGKDKSAIVRNALDRYKKQLLKKYGVKDLREAVQMK